MFKALLAIAIVAAAAAQAQPVPRFTYPDTESARRDWHPQFGSQPVQVERLPDGTTCVALNADFAAPGARACWDWSAPLDLSGAGGVVFDIDATNGGLVATLGIYFGTQNGWYPAYRGSLPDGWTPMAFALDAFGTEGKPDGWDKVTTFRFSVWSNAAGKATFRLRNLRLVKRDPKASYVRNGSFEIPGVGVPYAWGSGHWGVGNLPWAADMDLWRRHFHLDADVAHDGKASLCLDNTADLPRLNAVSAWINLPKTNPAYVLSAWLKSDQEKLPVALSGGGKSATADVGRDWTQVVVKGLAPGQNLAVNVAPQAAGKLWIDAVQVQAGDEATPEYHPHPDTEALAAREAQVDWSPPRREASVAAGRHITGPVQPAKVEIDANGRFLLDGKPYLQHSLGLEFVSDLRVIDVAAQLGFRDVCIEVAPRVSTAELTGFFDRCAQDGLRVIPWLDGTIPRDLFEAHIRALKGHPALLAWYVMDEPSGDGFKEAKARYHLAKELDPAHPAFINYLSNKLQGQAGDLYSTDVYPIPHGTPSDAINSVATMQAAAVKEHKPVWMWLQGTGYAYWMDREPSPRELSCMVYGSLIAGARGIFYFAQIPRTKQCLDEMRAMCVELDALTPALGSLEAAPEVACDQKAVMARAFVHEGSLWVLAVNRQREPVTAQFTARGADGAAEVVFEGRKVTARGGAWRDQFWPYERHVYRFAPQQ